MALSRIRQVHGGADYHDPSAGHWIDDHIATPMARFPDYSASRQSLDINVLGTLVVEIEAEDGTIGFAVTTGASRPATSSRSTSPASWRGAIRPKPRRSGTITQYYGRKGLVINAISGVDLAPWDLLGELLGEPVHQLIGRPVRDELHFYATGARPDIAKELGFLGGKLPLHHGLADGLGGIAQECRAPCRHARDVRRRFSG